MRATRLASAVSAVRWGAIALLTVLLASCNQMTDESNTIQLQVYQKWQLQPGEVINGRRVLAGLGDISIALDGNPVYAPFDGRAQKDQRECLIFSTPDVPAYLFRLCGLSELRLGDRRQGDELGKGSMVHFATLRKQPDGTWAIVEPSEPIIKKILSKSSGS
ncbi:MAG: hypothetical protein NW220_20795 [Leptolyngbyaceae cyanobacterium bins.349]|nr:hypothetical protein [Leptolyngbyaceae cyanobacterium bins.349]